MTERKRKIRDSSYWGQWSGDPYSSDEGQTQAFVRRKLRSHSSSDDESSSTTSTIVMSAMDTGTAPASAATESKSKWDSHMIPGLNPLCHGFPRSLITKLKYIEAPATFTTVGVTPQTNIYRANSIFDPDFTGIGHQPLFYDTYAAIYQNYRVIGSKIRVTFAPLEDRTDTSISSVGGPWVVGIGGSTTTTAFGSSIRNRMEQNDSVWKILNARTGADGVQTVVAVFEPLRNLGFPAGDDTVSAGISTNPSKQWYWHVWVGQLTNSYTTTVSVTTEIEYTVELMNPLTPQAES